MTEPDRPRNEAGIRGPQFCKKPQVTFRTLIKENPPPAARYSGPTDGRFKQVFSGIYFLILFRSCAPAVKIAVVFLPDIAHTAYPVKKRVIIHLDL